MRRAICSGFKCCPKLLKPTPKISLRNKQRKNRKWNITMKSMHLTNQRRRRVRLNDQTEPNSVIHLLYFSKGTACADDLVVLIAFAKSSVVMGPGVGILSGSACSLQLILSKSCSFSIYNISLRRGFIAASLQTSLISEPLYPY